MNAVIRNDDENELLRKQAFEELSNFHDHCEMVALRLKKNTDDLTTINLLKDLFDKMLSKSKSLHYAQFNEALDLIAKLIAKLIQWDVYPKQISEFFLLVNDRIHLLARELGAGNEVDAEKKQQILIALQHVLLVSEPEELKEAIHRAICLLANHAISEQPNKSALFEENEIAQVLDSDDAFVLTQPDGSILSIEACPKLQPQLDIFIPKNLNNPILKAKDEVRAILCEPVIKAYHRLSERVAGHQYGQTIMELSVACNIIAGADFSSQELVAGVCLHDIALIAIPELLSKKEKLTASELELIHLHTEQGAQLVKDLGFNEVVWRIVLEHHERVDGRGYPYGLNGQQMSDAGKLLGILDSFNAMVNYRPYRKGPKSIFRAVNEINACVGTLYDEYWVKVFNTCLRNYWLNAQSFSSDVVCVENINSSGNSA